MPFIQLTTFESLTWKFNHFRSFFFFIKKWQNILCWCQKIFFISIIRYFNQKVLSKHRVLTLLFFFFFNIVRCVKIARTPILASRSRLGHRGLSCRGSSTLTRHCPPMTRVCGRNGLWYSPIRFPRERLPQAQTITYPRAMASPRDPMGRMWQRGSLYPQIHAPLSIVQRCPS